MAVPARRGAVHHTFGEANNPLYYLGAITYFLFWIVIASGLYLYVFFKTGVAEAAASVEYLTHDQWYFGGVLRSVHRYASDGMVLGMLLHLTRHFTFDRYAASAGSRGSRASRCCGSRTSPASTATCCRGIASRSSSPSARRSGSIGCRCFNGTLVRNFIFEGAVNDRLFSLCRSCTSDSRSGCSRCCGSTRSACRGAAPIRRGGSWRGCPHPRRARARQAGVSQGTADLATAPASLALDWFYLPIFPLFYKWSVRDVWLLVGGATLLFALLPWLPPKRRRRKGEFI
jgi:hypothetical protein